MQRASSRPREQAASNRSRLLEHRWAGSITRRKSHGEPAFSAISGEAGQRNRSFTGRKHHAASCHMPHRKLLGMTALRNSRKKRGRPIRPQITRGTKSGEADRSRPCEPRGISFRKSYAAFSPFLYECLYVCCCRTREPRARRRPVFRSPGGGAGYHRRPICVAWRGLLITCLSTRGFVIQRRPP